MNPSALPQGTVIRVGYPEKGSGRESIDLERVEGGWAEVGYHCVDCAADWTYKPEGLISTGDKYSAEKVGDLDAILEREGTWEVVSVPAAWLADRLQALVDSMENSPDYYQASIAEVALDAGLS
ncbi:hypothetical protein SEA_GINGERBUG_68 [Microbacterium phage Gingerbug]|nr:hypothetical protein SEA_GINGERBUG_68 [Microbacterium phage Gingerbug]